MQRKQHNRKSIQQTPQAIPIIKGVERSPDFFSVSCALAVTDNCTSAAGILSIRSVFGLVSGVIRSKVRSGLVAVSFFAVTLLSFSLGMTGLLSLVLSV